MIGGSDGTPATLTVEPGAELRFQPGTGLRVLAIGGAPIGALIAEGRPNAPIRFTSAAAVPQRGDWSNLWFEGPAHGATRLAHAEISYAGGWCSCWLTSCTPVESYEAAVIIEGPPASVFIEDTVIRESAGHGIVRSWLDHEELDFAERNTFDGVAGCDQTWPELSDTVCPVHAYVDASVARYADLELTLEPVGPLIDGSEGTTLVRTPDAGGLVEDVPIGQYTISARDTRQGRDLLLRLQTDDGPAQAAVTTVFEPLWERELCADCIRLELEAP